MERHTLYHSAIYISYSLSTWNENRLDGFEKPALVINGGGDMVSHETHWEFFKCSKVHFRAKFPGQPELEVKNLL